MKVTTQTLENRQVEMAIEIEDERVQQALQQTARRIARQINIPGFRKGKAPYSVVVRAVGEQTLYEEMLKEAGPQWVKEALQEAELDPFRPGEMSDMRMNPLSFKITFALRPVVDLGDYRSLRVPLEVSEVAEEDINDMLEDIRQRNALLEPAGDGPAEQGHVAALDIAATAGGKAWDLSGLADQSGNISLVLDEQKDPWLPGFSANVIGMKAGDEKQFSLRVPDDFGDERLRGQPVDFTVRLNELKTLFVPPLDDALAQTIGNYETLDQLRAALRSTLEQNLKAQAEAGYADKCIEQLTRSARIEFPPVLVEEELDKMMEEVERRLHSQKMSLAELLNIKKQTKEEYRDEMRPRAVMRLRQGLALGQFIEAEKIVAGEGQPAEVIDKVVARLTAICRGELPAVELTQAETLATAAPQAAPSDAALQSSTGESVSFS